MVRLVAWNCRDRYKNKGNVDQSEIYISKIWLIFTLTGLPSVTLHPVFSKDSKIKEDIFGSCQTLNFIISYAKYPRKSSFNAE